MTDNLTVEQAREAVRLAVRSHDREIDRMQGEDAEREVMPLVDALIASVRADERAAHPDTARSDAIVDAVSEYDSCVVAWNAAVDSRCHEECDAWRIRKSEAFDRLCAAISADDTEGQ